MKRMIMTLGCILMTLSPLCAMHQPLRKDYVHELTLLLECLQQTLVRIQHTKPHDLCSFAVDTTHLDPLYTRIGRCMNVCENFKSDEVKKQLADIRARYTGLKQSIAQAIMDAGSDVVA